jgi:hypothetical protein
LTLELSRHKRILREVRRGIRCRKGHGDHEVSRGKTKQDENKCFARPARKQIFQHGDAALTVRACFGNPAVNGKSAE